MQRQGCCQPEFLLKQLPLEAKSSAIAAQRNLPQQEFYDEFHAGANSYRMTMLNSPVSGFAAAVVNALSSNICVLDRDGFIIAVNRAWEKFGEENSVAPRKTDIGTHYLSVCRAAAGQGSEGASELAVGVECVLTGTSEQFQIEYPCHSPTEARWFLARATPLELEQGGAVVSHANITDRKLLEFDLAKLAATDPLTGVPNRRYFLETAALELDRLKRFGAEASLVMIDLDHFKSVNDTYGHAAGDEALRCVGKACQNSVRKVDLLARLGGEEFAVLLSNTALTKALIVAERVRLAVAVTEFDAGGGTPHRLTASVGVTQVSQLDRTVEDALRRADGALYNAKSAGRNRVASSG